MRGDFGFEESLRSDSGIESDEFRAVPQLDWLAVLSLSRAISGV
jgi:hypothetical protein